MLFIDCRCFCRKCENRTEDVYRMVGACSNCGAEPVLMLFRVGDRAHSRGCPTCGVSMAVKPQRLAESDEVPA